MAAERFRGLPHIGIYWTVGEMPTTNPMLREAYQTCARCGAFVNSPDRHDDWHRAVEPAQATADQGGES